MSDPDTGTQEAMERLSARERSTLALLGLLSLAALGVLTWQRQRPALVITGAPALTVAAVEPSPAQTADWDHQLRASRQVDVNAADAAELERLPGIGPALAKRIVEERDRSGPFSSTEDLTRVPGIGPKTLDRLKEHVATE